MEMLLNQIVSVCAYAGSRIVLALIVFAVGKIVISRLLALLGKGKVIEKLEGSARTFTLSFTKIALYLILAVSIIGILGVPMTSVITIMASAGVAVGLALQGALSNLAGGIMLVIFKPFQIGDFVEAAGVSGVINEVSLFYTVFITLDNRRVTVPNGNLMNANVVDYSSETLRRVDLTFSCAKSESPAKVQDLMMQVMNANRNVLQSPAPFARLSGGTNEAMGFTVRAWCNNADYWDVYFDLTQTITEKLGESGVNAPAIRIVSGK